MNDPLLRLREAAAAVEAAWPRDSESHRSMDAIADHQLLAVNDALSALVRHADALRGRIAAEISRRSRSELGSESLAKRSGFRSATALIAASSGGTIGEAARLVAVGEATTPRRTLTGADAPPRHPHVADAVSAGSISTAAASALIKMMDRVALRCDPVEVDHAETLLVAQAPGLTLDQLGKVIARAEAYLDPDGLEPKEERLRGERSVQLFQRDGLLHLTAKLDPESAAPVKAAIEAIVTAQFRNESATGPQAASRRDADAPRRTVAQRQADALVLIAQHALDCDSSDLPLDGATVIVRISHEELQSGAGAATVDGIDQPVSVATARRMAAGGGVIPCVLGGASEILDWGRSKRLFTTAQKLALAERDGGCAMCGLPPGMTKAHHIRWWARDAGPTDLSNGVLLCESCHHRIHDNDWDIRIDGIGVRARVWFIPPPHVDPARTPRLGGRARYAWAA